MKKNNNSVPFYAHIVEQKTRKNSKQDFKTQKLERKTNKSCSADNVASKNFTNGTNANGKNFKNDEKNLGKNYNAPGKNAHLQQKNSSTKNFAQKKITPANPAKQNQSYKFSVLQSVFAPLDAKSKAQLDDFDTIAQSVWHLDSKKVQMLPQAIRALSHQLTDERGERRVGYMNSTEGLSAYVRYFAWWNMHRLSSIFASIKDEFAYLEDGDYLLDIGSGPLTVPMALWLACPALREKKLHFYVMDMSQNALAIGEELFLSLASRLPAQNGDEPWQIIRVKGSFGTSLKHKAAAVFCANMCNELYEQAEKTPDENAKYCSKELRAFAKEDATLFVAEPGTPPSSHFVSLLRDNLMRNNWQIVSPCPHANNCAMPGTHLAKWCHFAQDASTCAPALVKLSKNAKLPKDKAVVAYVFAKSKNLALKMPLNATLQDKNLNAQKLLARIASHEIKLPSFVSASCTGRYACSSLGLLLVTGKSVGNLGSGSLIQIDLRGAQKNDFALDKKTGASIIELE